MSTDIIADDSDNWKAPDNVPDKAPTTDRVLDARVRFLQAAFAQQILAIPPDVSKQSRAIRLGKIRGRVSDWLNWMNTTYTHNAGATVKVTNDRARRTWYPAEAAAWNSITAAVAAGTPLTGFLFPSEGLDS
jgi:hypothetical protein